MTGPPPSTPASCSCDDKVWTVPFWDWYCFHVPSRPVGRVYPNTDPRRLFVPLLVMTFTTPPTDWPNSASYPPVLTWTSLKKSKGIALPSDPKTIEYDPRAP